MLISNYGEFYRLAAYVPLHEKMIGIVMGVPTLRELFEEKYYADLEGAFSNRSGGCSKMR